MSSKKFTVIISNMLLLWTFLLLQLSVPKTILACGEDDFVYEEFGKRCVKIAEMIQELKVAQAMKLPAKQIIKGKLLNEWIDFYLAHGNVSPGNIEAIATTSWKLCVQSAGKNLSDIAYERIKPENADIAVIPFFLLGQPEKMKKIHEVMVSWSTIIDEEPNMNTASTTIWIQKNLVMFDSIGSELFEFPSLGKDMKSFVMSTWQNWRYVAMAKGEAGKIALKFTFPEVAAKIRKKFNTWKILAFQ